MADNTKIEWATHTWNPWLGCSKVSPACAHCYAEAWAKRAGHPELWQGERRRTSPEYWQRPLKWDRIAAASGERPRVFPSLCDPFDNQVPSHIRDDFWHRIEQTPHLDWLLLTKRPQNVAKMLPDPRTGVRPWGDGWPNVWLGITAENQSEYDRRWPYLREIPAHIRFISYEPALGPLDVLRNAGCEIPHWIICGGEDGPRPMHPAWARSIRDQCSMAGIWFLFKQWGSWAPGENAGFPATRTARTATWRNGAWDFGRLTPRESQEQHRDDAPDLYRLGKRAAGRHLDGQLHDGVPGDE